MVHCRAACALEPQLGPAAEELTQIVDVNAVLGLTDVYRLQVSFCMRMGGITCATILPPGASLSTAGSQRESTNSAEAQPGCSRRAS